jgi:hypothetical protein
MAFLPALFLASNGILSVFHHGFYGLNGLHGKDIQVMGLDLPLISGTLILEEGMNSPPTQKIREIRFIRKIRGP